MPATSSSPIDLIGLRFDGYGRQGNQARASQVLREAGIGRFAGRPATDRDDIAPPHQSGQRGSDGLINEEALVYVKDQLGRMVAASIRAGRFPFVFGGDCSALPGSMIGAREALGEVALVHVDGHEDTTPLDASEDGEAANSEIGMLLGIVGRSMRGPVAAGLPVLQKRSLALIGQRDDRWRRDLNLGSLEDLGVFKRGSAAVAADPAGTARAAVAHLRRSTSSWWLHIDVDVLDPVEFPAQGLPDFPDEPGGLSKRQLDTFVDVIAVEDGCVGARIAIYDPDQDADGSGARYVVELTHRLLGD